MASVELLAIKFNHDTGSHRKDAMNIRRNATQTVTVPEWRRGITTAPEDSPAAYSIADTEGNTLSIRANLRRNGDLGDVEVRAVDPAVDPPRPGGCVGIIIRILLALVRALTGNVLGEVKARSVTFGPDGETGFIEFQLENVALWSRGVGVRTTEWRWQYRTSGGSWTDFDTSKHRVYSVLSSPTAPWQQTPYSASNKALPWTEALDKACTWAVLASDPVKAGEMVTRAIYNLGPSVVTYDCPGGGATHYAMGSSFNLSAFLDRLAGGYGNGYYVNCTDCATFTSTFSNLLGVDLWQSRMQWSFGLNPLLAIGSSTWQPACGWSGFSYHEVAWTGACDVGDRVYDACLQVDGDADPTSAPHVARQPTNMIFGAVGAGQYRDKLATPAGRPNCSPAPSTRKRRSVF